MQIETQGDFFEVGSDVNLRTIFPRFHTKLPMAKFLGNTEPEGRNRDILKRLGFFVNDRRNHMLNHTDRILVYPSGPKNLTVALFEVEYPEGWCITEEMDNVYTGDHNGVRQILDEKGHLRGIAHCMHDGVPFVATMYTRYAVVEDVELNFSQLPFERDDQLKSVVIDYTKFDRFNPSRISEVEHIDYLWLLGEKYPELKEMSQNERSKWMDANMSVDVWASLLGVSGSSLWLDENFPDWKDPVAYWP